MNSLMFFSARWAVRHRRTLDAMEVFEERRLPRAQLDEDPELSPRLARRSLEENRPGREGSIAPSLWPRRDPFHFDAASLRSLSRWARFDAVTLHGRLLRSPAGSDAAALLSPRAALFASSSAISLPGTSICPGTQRMTTSVIPSCTRAAASSLS